MKNKKRYFRIVQDCYKIRKTKRQDLPSQIFRLEKIGLVEILTFKHDFSRPRFKNMIR